MQLSRFGRCALYTVLGALIISPVVPKLVSADWQTCGLYASNACSPGVLHVYMLVNNDANAPQQRVPSDFAVSVQAQNASNPAAFPGSQSGTTLTVAGQYLVSVAPLQNFTPNYSVGCNGSVVNGQEATCIITMSATSGYSSVPQPYPYPYAGPLPLVCSTPTPTVNLNQTATFTAVGGSGTYTWGTPTQTYQGIGPTLNVSFPSTGLQTITVMNGSQMSTCTVNVVASGAPAAPVALIPPSQPGSPATVAPAPIVTSQYIPKLPNTGFAPVSAYQALLALAALIAAGFAVAPYVRKAATIALG